MDTSKTGRKEQIIRDFFTATHEGQVPNLTVQALYSAFMQSEAAATADISYGLFNGVVKKLRTETGSAVIRQDQMNVNASPDAMIRRGQTEYDTALPVEIDSMEFPVFNKYLSNTILDKLMSDHDPEGGLFGGTAYIMIGESGVGKSTVALDLLAKIMRASSEAIAAAPEGHSLVQHKGAYLSSEMTMNDLFFYRQKMPIIGKIPTILLAEYLTGRFDLTIENFILEGDYDVLLIDSYQDIIVKLKEILGWKSTLAEAWLTNLIIKASDKRGKSIIAIQHMTKGGTYVGSTYLKHATQGMMQMSFDDSRRRYIEFTKNRRGGSMVGRRMYYSLVNGEVAWDTVAWHQEEVASKLTENESDRRHKLEEDFNEIFLSVKNTGEGVVDAAEARSHENVETGGSEVPESDYIPFEEVQ